MSYLQVTNTHLVSYAKGTAVSSECSILLPQRGLGAEPRHPMLAVGKGCESILDVTLNPTKPMHRLRDATCPSQPPTINVTTCIPSLDLQIRNIVNSYLTSILDPSKDVRDNDDWNEHGQRTVVQHFRRGYSLNRTVPKIGGRHRLIIK